MQKHTARPSVLSSTNRASTSNQNDASTWAHRGEKVRVQVQSVTRALDACTKILIEAKNRIQKEKDGQHRSPTWALFLPLLIYSSGLPKIQNNIQALATPSVWLL